MNLFLSASPALLCGPAGDDHHPLYGEKGIAVME